MGLSGRKTKQRIPNDPRNLNWANDANKFGAAYLAKFGWDSSQGLGVDGDGRKQAISVTQKLDMLGIGADHRNSEEGLAWKQNKDFENLLKRLNAANGTEQKEEEVAMKVDGFVRAGPGAGAGTMQDTEEDSSSDGDEKRSKKKRKKETKEEDGEERKKKRKKSKSSGEHPDAEEESKKDKKKKKKQESSGESHPASASQHEAAVVPAVQPAAAPSKSKAPRPHRARHMASKNLASKSASAIAEILGIAPDPSTYTSAAPSGSATPYSGFSSTPFPSTPYELGPSTSASPTPAPGPTQEELKLQELTVSSKSVMDYFKEKLAAKSNAASGSATPVTLREEELDDYADRPRVGLGASRLRVETTVEEAREVRGGLGGIGSGSRMQFAAMFAKASTTATVTTEPVPVEQTEAPKPGKEKKSKKEKQDKKGKAKEGVADEDAADAALDAGDGTDEKAERKRRKEEKRRRKEAEALAASAQETAAATPDSDEAQQERKRKKEKRKSKRDS